MEKQKRGNNGISKWRNRKGGTMEYQNGKNI